MLREHVLRARRRFDEAGFFEQRQDDFEFGQRQLRDLAQVGERNAAFLRAEDLERAEDALHFFDVGIFAGEEIVLHARVAHAIDEDALRRLAVAAGAARFLRVGFDRTRQIVVHDEADVRLVDAEAERVGRDDGFNRLLHEEFVHGDAVVLLQFRVIDGGRNVEMFLQILLHFERVLDRRRVDDAGAVEIVVLEQRLERAQLARFVFRAAHAVDQVRAIEAAHDRLDVGDAELREDVFAHGRRGGRGEREHGRFAERLDDAAEIEIGRAEVVAPLADAMRFVDHEQRHGQASAGSRRTRRLRVFPA